MTLGTALPGAEGTKGAVSRVPRWLNFQSTPKGTPMVASRLAEASHREQLLDSRSPFVERAGSNRRPRRAKPS